MKVNYVANQITPEGLDEVQRLLLQYSLGQHTALSGPPGVGKTELVENLPALLGKSLFETTCDELMIEGPLIGFPGLTGSNGSTITKWELGIVSKAMVEGGIAYLDEFDQLSGTVQKRLNSAFDGRGKVTRGDAEEIIAKLGFFGVVSYNPSKRISKSEMEDSVADRFVHLKFDYMPQDLEAALMIDGTEGFYYLRGEGLITERGVIKGDKLTFVKRDPTSQNWIDFFTEKQVTNIEGLIQYSAFPKAFTTEKVATEYTNQWKLALKMAEFVGIVRGFSETGTNQLDEPVKEYLKGIGEVTSVPLHQPSLRIERAAMSQYGALVKMGMAKIEAQAHATRVVVDQTCYGKYGLRPLGKATTQKAVESLGEHFGLLPRRSHTSTFTT